MLSVLVDHGVPCKLLLASTFEQLKWRCSSMILPLMLFVLMQLLLWQVGASPLQSKDCASDGPNTGTRVTLC